MLEGLSQDDMDKIQALYWGFLKTHTASNLAEKAIGGFFPETSGQKSEKLDIQLKRKQLGLPLDDDYLEQKKSPLIGFGLLGGIASGMLAGKDTKKAEDSLNPIFKWAHAVDKPPSMPHISSGTLKSFTGRLSHGSGSELGSIARLIRRR